MSRNKYPEVTIERILDVSLKLFLEKGYEQTTIQDIVDELGDLSKGAIYHHFKGKEEIIDAVTTRLFNKDNPFDKVKNAPGLNGIEKIQKIFENAMINNEKRKLIQSATAILKSPKFLAKQIEECVSILAPKFQELIEEGVRDGSICISNPKQASEILILIINIWLNPAIFNVSEREYIEKIKYFKIVMEQIGLPIVTDDFINEFSKTIDKTMVDD